MKLLVKYIFAFSLVTMAGSASANNPPTQLEPKPYIGFDGGFTFIQETCSKVYTHCDNSEPKLGFLYGVSLTDYFAIETGFQFFGTYKGFLNTTDKSDISSIDLSAKFAWGVSPTANVFFKAGGMRWMKEFRGHIENNTGSGRERENGYSPALTVGVDYHFRDNWDLSLSYQWANQFGGQNTDLNQVSIGFNYFFN
ncbi:porin family protein [Shewanella sp. A25]|nr:porin family protein [Shewanella shenzhenensis]